MAGGPRWNHVNVCRAALMSFEILFDHGIRFDMASFLVELLELELPTPLPNVRSFIHTFTPHHYAYIPVVYAVQYTNITWT